MHLNQNIKGLCAKFGISFHDFLNDLNVDDVHELTVFDLQAVCEEYEIDLYSLIFVPLFKPDIHKKKLEKIKFLVTDVDGVLTDGGMFVTESGDEMKKFNTKDGMAIIKLPSFGIKVGFLSSGFTHNMVQRRAALLGVEKCYVGRENKLEILNQWRSEMNLDWSEIAYLGDDINDREIMQKVGVSACPKNAVQTIKKTALIPLTSNGGEGCVREFVDEYLLSKPLQ